MTWSRRAAFRLECSYPHRPIPPWRSGSGRLCSKVAFSLPVFHRRVAHPVVAAGGPALSQPGDLYLLNDLGERGRLGRHAGGEVGVANRTVANSPAVGPFAVYCRREFVDRIEHPGTFDYLALLAEVQLGQWNVPQL